MRKRILFILLIALACTYVYAQSFCHLAQPVGTHYEDTIESAGVYYYSAWTYDLPMDVYITSLDPTCSEPPQVWADLTCNPGVYDDPNVQDLVRDTAKYGISVPMALGCETTFENGHYVHHLKLGKSYRNRLQLIGVDYNVEAYVKVVIPCAGVALLEQDTSSQACFRDARWLRLVDSTHVLAYDTLTSYIFPYKDWLTETDSIALYWEGTQDARIWVGETCDFQADVQHAWDYYDLPANGEIHLSKNVLTNAAQNAPDSAGFLFARVVCPEEGRLFTRPLSPELYGATLMQYDSTYKVTISDSAFYCFPNDTSWPSIEWIADTRKVVKMYLHTSPEEAAVDSFKFDLQDSTRRVWTWTTPEMNMLRSHSSLPLFFVRFKCSKDFKFTPYRMGNKYCSLSSLRVRPGVPLPSGKNYVYRFYYEDWKGYPMDMYWEYDQVKKIKIFIADTCQFEPDSRKGFTTSHSVYIKEGIDRFVTVHVDSATIAGWESRVPVDGFYFVRTNQNGTLTFTTTKPEEQDPEGDDPEDQTPGDDVTTGWINTPQQTEYRKILHNGQILILRAGKAYTMTGQLVKID